MKEKNKRGEGQWKLSIVLFFAVILAMGIVSPFVYGNFAPSPYVTQTWVDPDRLCSTNWYVGTVEENYLADFEANFNALNLPLRIKEHSWEYASLGCMAGLGYYEFNVVFQLDTTYSSDEVSMGNLVREIVAIIEDVSIVSFNFQQIEGNYLYWRTDLSEAKRAIAAGLRGAELWEIGQ